MTLDAGLRTQGPRFRIHGGSASAWIAEFVLIRVWRRLRSLDVLARAVTGVNQAAPSEVRQCRAIRRHIVHLEMRAFVPVHAEPAEVFNRLLLRHRLDARRVQILDAKHHAPALLSRQCPVDEERPRVAKMQRAGRRRSEPGFANRGHGESVAARPAIGFHSEFVGAALHPRLLRGWAAPTARRRLRDRFWYPRTHAPGR